ncbi:MetS family NSS transporter small subunit [Demequina aestuarii]|nr:MetS family NSS transporter small subunit [Demequina aestuarii]
MSADAWALLIVTAAVIWGGLVTSVVWLGRHRGNPMPFDDEEAS